MKDGQRGRSGKRTNKLSAKKNAVHDDLEKRISAEAFHVKFSYFIRWQNDIVNSYLGNLSEMTDKSRKIIGQVYSLDGSQRIDPYIGAEEDPLFRQLVRGAALIQDYHKLHDKYERLEEYKRSSQNNIAYYRNEKTGCFKAIVFEAEPKNNSITVIEQIEFKPVDKKCAIRII
jgi:hypothetical protein